VLLAATARPARFFGLPDRGVIGAGKRADLLLIDGDPLTDIRATRSVRRVWCGGTEHRPADTGK
jgi:imidazolonepropionase-like amidohydrolase